MKFITHKIGEYKISFLGVSWLRNLFPFKLEVDTERNLLTISSEVVYFSIYFKDLKDVLDEICID